MATSMQDQEPNVQIKNDDPTWNHPYLIYILLTGALFLFLLGIGYLALDQGWVPHRGMSVSLGKIR